MSFIVELEPGCWLAPWMSAGDARTYQRFHIARIVEVTTPSFHDAEVEVALAETKRDPGLARLRELAKAEGLL